MMFATLGVLKFLMLLEFNPSIKTLIWKVLYLYVFFYLPLSTAMNWYLI